MKIFTLQSVHDLKKPVDPNEFISRDKYESATSLVVKFDERFPIKKDLRVESKRLAENEHIVHQKKKLVDMTYNDMELLQIAFHRAVHNAEVKSLERKRAKIRDIRRKDDLDSILSEIGGQKFRIFMSWIRRFHMENLFEGLKVKSLDNFKHLAHHFHVHADDTQRVQLEQFLRQFGLDPKHFPTPIKYDQLTGKDRLILREKAEDDSVKLIDLSDVRLRMAQLQSATHIAQQEATHQAIKEHVQKHYRGPTETQKRINAIKK